MIRTFQLIVNGERYEIAVEAIQRGAAPAAAQAQSPAPTRVSAAPAPQSAPAIVAVNMAAAQPAAPQPPKPSAPTPTPAPRAVKAPVPRPAAPSPAQSDGSGAAKEGSFLISAPVSGTVQTINVCPGAAAKRGYALMILEEARVEHPVLAPFDCTLCDLRVTPGMHVEAGAPLCTVDRT